MSYSNHLSPTDARRQASGEHSIESPSSKLQHSDDLYTVLQMMSLKIIDLSLRLSKQLLNFQNSCSSASKDVCNEDQSKMDIVWEQNFSQTFKRIHAREKQVQLSTYYKTLLPLMKFVKQKQSVL